LEPTTYVLATEGGGYWSGLIVPAVIIMVGLLTAAVVLLVSREPAEKGPVDRPRRDEALDETHEDE